MTTTDILLGLVVDKSGSMGNLRASTCEGINSLIADQADQPGKALISLTLFDTTFDVRQVAVDARDFPALGGPKNPYATGGMTSLYDAVGTTVRGIEAWLAGHPDFDGAVKVAIFTDGEENSSRQWHTFEPRRTEDVWDLNNLIEWKQGEGWEFIFMGAGGSAWTEGKRFTALADTAVFNYVADAHVARHVYAGASATLTSARSTGGSFADAASVNETLLSNTSNRGDTTP